MIEIEYHYYPTSNNVMAPRKDHQCLLIPHKDSQTACISWQKRPPPKKCSCQKNGPDCLNLILFFSQKYRRQCNAFSRNMTSPPVCCVFHYDLTEGLGVMACGMRFCLSFIKNRKFWAGCNFYELQFPLRK